MARELARSWVHTCLVGWERDGVMHEKYHSHRLGERGEGGEYMTHEGFAWTNGVVLQFLAQYGEAISVDI